MLVKDCMIKHPAMVQPTMPILEAQRYMVENNVRYLLVVGKGRRLLGLVSRHTLLTQRTKLDNLNIREISRFFSNLTVGDILLKSKDIITIEQERTIRKAAGIMVAKQIGCLPVLERGLVVGIVTEIDLLNKLTEMAEAKEPNPLLAEDESFDVSRALASLTRPPAVESVSQRNDMDALYSEFGNSIEALDVFSNERLTLSPEELIEFRPGNLDFILSIPHSGVLVPTEYAEHFDLNLSSLVEVDLFSNVVFESLGGAQVISRLAPFFVDMNRGREGLKRSHIPKHLKNPATEYYTIDDELILQKPYSPSEKEEVLKYYDLYHQILSTLIERMKQERGYALLIDGHSMMSTGLGRRVHDMGQKRDNFVLGTLRGTSACKDIISAFTNGLKQGIQGTRSRGLNLTFTKDRPYAGGFITQKFHDPGNDVHVIQVEVVMDTYMYEPVDEDSIRRYALKQPRVAIVQDILRNAVRSACEMAKQIYSR